MTTYKIPAMEIVFGNDDLDRLETDPRFTAGLSPALVKAYRKRIQLLRSINDERGLYAWKSLHSEKLKGKRAHQLSVRLNDQFRLILEFAGEGKAKKLVIISVEDYHD